jgi:hypothetical protein
VAAASGKEAAETTGADLKWRLAALWPETVGAEIAANARPVQLRDGRLVVATSSAAWAQTLQLMSEVVVRKVNEGLGAAVVERAVFRHAGWEDFPGRAAADAGSAGWNSKAPEALPGDEAPSDHAAGESMSVGAERGARLAGGTAPSHGPLDGDDTARRGQATGLSDAERQALADVDGLPLPAAMKAIIRQTMVAGFVRARQDSDR